MLSIGELAQRTGVSRRMLRHWEDVGLLVPADVDPWSGRRRYELRQAGRVRGIAALRAVGFGLDAIRDLLNSELTEERLIALLKQRSAELADQVSEASTRLREVRTRLESLEKGHDIIMETLTLTALDELTIVGLQESVADESEISGAVARLLALLPDASRDGQDVFLVYDGTTDESVITVTAGTLPRGGRTPSRGGRRLIIAGPQRAARVIYPESPVSIADAWIAIGTELEKQALRTTGPHRQTLHPDGRVTLEAGVTEVGDCV